MNESNTAVSTVPKQQNPLMRYFMLNAGFFICALGVTFLLQSGLGVSPWDVLASGLANTIGISVGKSIVLISVIIVAASVLSGSSIGTGTLLNMLLIGTYIDVIQSFGIIQTPDSFLMKLAWIFIGTIILNFGIYLYFAQGLGAGPRDGMMVILANKFNLTVGVTKIIIEVVVVIAGALLGGMFGLGTVVIALCSGPMLNMQQRLIGVDLKKIQHTYLPIPIKKAA